MEAFRPVFAESMEEMRVFGSLMRSCSSAVIAGPILLGAFRSVVVLLRHSPDWANCVVLGCDHLFDRWALQTDDHKHATLFRNLVFLANAAEERRVSQGSLVLVFRWLRGKGINLTEVALESSTDGGLWEAIDRAASCPDLLEGAAPPACSDSDEVFSADVLQPRRRRKVTQPASESWFTPETLLMHCSMFGKIHLDLMCEHAAQRCQAHTKYFHQCWCIEEQDLTTLTWKNFRSRLMKLRDDLTLAADEPLRVFVNPPFGVVEAHVATLCAHMASECGAVVMLVTPLYGHTSDETVEILAGCPLARTVSFAQRIDFCKLIGKRLEAQPNHSNRPVLSVFSRDPAVRDEFCHSTTQGLTVWMSGK